MTAPTIRGLVLTLALAITAPTLAGEPRTAIELAQDARGPTVILCLYGQDGRKLAGHDDCPVEASPSDDMMAEAHCFYNAAGELWRGLPRCPRQAPEVLMRDLRAGEAPTD